jgi:hypothetical protein
MKYHKILAELQEGELYTAAKIAEFAEAKGFISVGGLAEVRLAKQRIRLAMGRFRTNHQFPKDGDGLVYHPGQAPTPGWFGWRWQAAIPRHSANRRD